MNSYSKYLKYKTKYLNLKHNINQKGGNKSYTDSISWRTVEEKNKLFNENKQYFLNNLCEFLKTSNTIPNVKNINFLVNNSILWNHILFAISRMNINYEDDESNTTFVHFLSIISALIYLGTILATGQITIDTLFKKNKIILVDGENILFKKQILFAMLLALNEEDYSPNPSGSTNKSIASIILELIKNKQDNASFWGIFMANKNIFWSTISKYFSNANFFIISKGIKTDNMKIAEINEHVIWVIINCDKNLASRNMQTFNKQANECDDVLLNLIHIVNLRYLEHDNTKEKSTIWTYDNYDWMYQGDTYIPVIYYLNLNLPEHYITNFSSKLEKFYNHNVEDSTFELGMIPVPELNPKRYLTYSSDTIKSNFFVNRKDGKIIDCLFKINIKNSKNENCSLSLDKINTIEEQKLFTYITFLFSYGTIILLPESFVEIDPIPIALNPSIAREIFQPESVVEINPILLMPMPMNIFNIPTTISRVLISELISEKQPISSIRPVMPIATGPRPTMPIATGPRPTMPIATGPRPVMQLNPDDFFGFVTPSTRATVPTPASARPALPVLAPVPPSIQRTQRTQRTVLPPPPPPSIKKPMRFDYEGNLLKDEN